MKTKTLTCRHCDRPLYVRTPTEASPMNWGRKSWFSHGQGGGSVFEEDTNRMCADGKRPLPKEVCCYPKTSSDIYEECSNPVKYEDIAAKNYACGVHMRHFVEDRERAEAEARRRKDQKQQEEILAWEEVLYQAAYDRLMGQYPEVFPASERPRLRWGRLENREVKMDVIELERILRESREQSVAES